MIDRLTRGAAIPPSLMKGPFRTVEDIDGAMRILMGEGHADLPLPGQGATAERWGILAAVAFADLSLAKVFESHADARAILAELGEPVATDVLGAVWAAENPTAPLVFDPQTNRVTGVKQWCSGAEIVDEGLLTAKTPGGAGVLVRVDMHQGEIAVQAGDWAHAGIAAAGTTSIKFAGARAAQVGAEDAYLERPGFWQGGAGIAAVWYGGAAAVAAHLAASPRIRRDPHCAAHLGAIHSQLQAARALLLSTAAGIDRHPRADAMVPAQTLRAAVEMAASETLRRTGRALGAAPLCTNPEHATRVADLEIYLRQSHAERDLAALGEAIGGGGGKDGNWLWSSID